MIDSLKKIQFHCTSSKFEVNAKLAEPNEEE